MKISRNSWHYKYTNKFGFGTSGSDTVCTYVAKFVTSVVLYAMLAYALWCGLYVAYLFIVNYGNFEVIKLLVASGALHPLVFTMGTLILAVPVALAVGIMMALTLAKLVNWIDALVEYLILKTNNSVSICSRINYED